MKNHEDIKRLTQKYLEGSTSRGDEIALAEFFRSGRPSPDPETESLRAMFEFFDGQAARATAPAAFKPRTLAKPSGPRLRRTLSYCAGVAAAAAVLACITLMWPPHRTAEPLVACAWVDGQMITDPQQVEQIYLGIMAHALPPKSGDGRKSDIMDRADRAIGKMKVLGKVDESLSKLRIITDNSL